MYAYGGADFASAVLAYAATWAIGEFFGTFLGAYKCGIVQSALSASGTSGEYFLKDPAAGRPLSVAVFK